MVVAASVVPAIIELPSSTELHDLGGQTPHWIGWENLP